MVGRGDVELLVRIGRVVVGAAVDEVVGDSETAAAAVDSSQSVYSASLCSVPLVCAFWWQELPFSPSSS